MRLSQQTKRPILVCVNMDGEIASEHYAGVRYRDPEIAKLWEPYVCVMASVYRHTPRDHDDQGRRIPCPRLGHVTCGEHIAMEAVVYEKFLDGKRISPRRADDYAAARRQGSAAAQGAVEAARTLGIARRSVLWFDLEHFDTGKRRCRLSALAFTSAWTRELHRLHYRSGFYSSASSGIAMLEGARRRHPDRYALPDYLWVAEWNGKDTVRSSYLSTRWWWPHRRVHQYRGPHDERDQARFGIVLVADLAVAISPGRVEIAQRDKANSVGLLVPR